MKTSLKKIIAGTSVATTLGVGAFTMAGAGAATSTPTAPTNGPTKAEAKHFLANHPRLRRQLRRHGADVAAKALGISRQDLVTELKAGKSLTDIANEHHVAPASVASALTNAADARIDKAVTAGNITPEQAAKLKAKVPQAVAKVMVAKRHNK